MFSWKRRGLAEVGVKGKSLGGKSMGSKNIGAFVLRTYTVGGMGVKKLHID